MATPDNSKTERRFTGWLFFPIALFPLVALLTYDHGAIGSLNAPVRSSTNWIGAIGDGFAYCAYLTFGLAAWIIPVLFIVIGARVVVGARLRPGRRTVWTLVFLVAAACLLDVLQSSAPGIEAQRVRFECMRAGGFVGYFIGSLVLRPLLSDIGTGVLLPLVLAASLVGSVGASRVGRFFAALGHWAMADENRFDPGDAKPGTEEYDNAQAAYNAALQAREEARRQREEEKERIRAEKAAARAAAEAAREAARQAKEEARLAKEAERLARQKEAERLAAERLETMKAAAAAARARAQQTRAPVPAPAPVAAPVPAAPAAPAAEAAPVEDKGPYILPSVSLLAPLKASTADHSDVGEMSQRLIDTLKLFGVDATMSYTVQGPVVTKYAVMLAPGTRYSTVTGLQDNLKGALRAKSLRIEAPIPGEECVGIEVPNRKPAGITFREIFESDAWKNAKAELPLLFGKRADGKELVADLASMPHMLVAGATGQGKSVCLNSLINGLLMTRTPEQLKLIMVDPKCVEFTPYSSIPHLLVPVITDNRKVVFSLHWAVAEMEKRLKMFARARVRNIYDFNHRKTFTQTDMFGNDAEVASDIPKTVPYIVIIIDEAADLIGQCGKEVNPDIQRITQKARAAGIHLILATQRPDAKIITGAIKANIPGRVAFKTSSSVDSRTILDDTGAENLIGRGDMLFKGKDGLLIRAQGAWISDEEIANVTGFIEQHSNVQFDDRFTKKLSTIKEVEKDIFADDEEEGGGEDEGAQETKQAQRELVKAAANADDFKKAVECVINTKRASTSHFQRQMGWGYNHAAKILDMLTERGIVSAPQGMGPRQIIMDQDQLVAILNGDDSTVASDGAAAEADDATTVEAGDGTDATDESLITEEQA